MFRKLPPAPDYAREQLSELAASMRDEDPAAGGWGGTAAPRDNPGIPAGYTYLGQFIDHDITFDPASSLERQNDVDALTNFRTPRLDLDSIYGSGPVDEPFQYVRGTRGLQMLRSRINDLEFDLPRNAEQVALLGDPRNDENIIVAQLQLFFLRLHDHIGREVSGDANIPPERQFAETQRRVRWLYQWVVMHDYVKRIVGEQTFGALVQHSDHGWDITRPHYRPRNNAYMPVEFSAAAFRFGHSQIRGFYDLNATVTGRPIFLPGDVGPTDDLRGFRPLPDGWTIDWPLFFEMGDTAPQPSRLIDTLLAPGLFQLPGFDADASLPLRNLLRGQSLGLPSGQDVAKHLRVDVLSDADAGPLVPTPLWFYLLKEAEVIGSGRNLGPAGGRIVGEVILGLIEMDPTGWLSIEPTWVPPGPSGAEFAMPDLLALVGPGPDA